MMKRNILILVVLTLILSACGQKVSEKKPQPEKKDNQVETEVPKTEEETTIKIGTPEPQNEELEKLEDIQTKYSDVDTSDWQTYTDESGLFSFKYPKDWEAQNDDYRIGLEKKGTPFYFEGMKIPPISMSLNGNCEGSNKSANKLEDTLSLWSQDFEIEDLRLGEFKAYETMTHLSKNFFVVFNKDKGCYLKVNWMVLGVSELDDENEVVYKGIISTLKFLK